MTASCLDHSASQASSLNFREVFACLYLSSELLEVRASCDPRSSKGSWEKGTDELLARVRALTRRHGEIILDEMRFGNTVLNISTGSLICGEKSVRLSFKELEMMKLLMASPNVIVPKEAMITKVWGYDSVAEDNNVEVYVSFLRKKLAFICSDINVVTVRKIGYHLETAG